MSEIKDLDQLPPSTEPLGSEASGGTVPPDGAPDGAATGSEIALLVGAEAVSDEFASLDEGFADDWSTDDDELGTELVAAVEVVVTEEAEAADDADDEATADAEVEEEAEAGVEVEADVEIDVEIDVEADAFAFV